MTRIQARFGARSVLIQELSEEGCRIGHAAPVSVGIELPLVFRCLGESFYIIARTTGSRLAELDPGPRYESRLEFLGSTRELTALSSVLRENGSAHTG